MRSHQGQDALKIEAVVFERDGNRFLASNFWWPEEDRPSGWLLNAMGFGISLDLNYGKELLLLEADPNGDPIIPCVRADMTSRKLQHGHGTVYMISGPLFDACKTVE